MKTAIVIGATGLVGSNLTRKLLDDPRYDCVKIFVRKSTQIVNSKIIEYIVDFDRLEEWKDKIVGNELFSAMGTTIKKAGSKEAQYKIDFTCQLDFAKAALKNGVSKYLLVSSMGASAKSRNFYLQMKGELDNEISKLPFQQIYIFRPSILVGERKEKRSGEIIGLKLINILACVIPPLKKYRPINADRVTQAMIKSANTERETKITIFESGDIFEI